MQKIFTFIASLLIISAVNGQMRFFYGILSGANEFPANASAASGVVVAKFNTSSKFLEVYGNYNGLTANVTVSHVHTGAAGANGPVLFDLMNTGGVSGNISGNSTLNGASETNLLANGLYVNVHSSTFPAGELRVQLNALADGDGVFSNARLQASQEVLPIGSTATGNAQVLLQKSTRNVYLTGSYAGLSANVTVSHIHLGRATTNGGVILNLTNSGGTTGSLHGSGILSQNNADSLIANSTYVNVHSSNYPSGEIRGQINNYSQIRFFGGRLSGFNEVPPVASVATGTVISRYNPETNVLELNGDYQNLSANISASHIHTGAAGSNGGVLVGIGNTGGTSGGLYIKTTITEAQEVDLLAGNLYVNVHSTNFPTGEIRTQLIPTTAGETQYAEMILSGLQQVPANLSMGVGGAVVLVDKVTGQTYISGVYSGMSSNVTMAHLHRGLAGTNGPVIMNLTHTGGTQGTVSGSQILTPAQVDSFVNGMTYINIHTANFATGEIRGQAGNLVLPVRWGQFTGYRQKNAVSLLWEALSEENTSHYEVEQQNTQTGNWMRRITVQAKGSSPASYKTEDLPAFFGEEFVTYRVKAVDKDGSFSWSPVLRINMALQNDNLILFGNPVTTSLRFRVSNSTVSRGATAIVADMQGRVLSQTAISEDGFQVISTTNLPSGLYILQVKNGQKVFTQKFVKQ